MPAYDGVVIGAGHNGLTLAAYLSRAGLRVAVPKRNARIGGGTSDRRAGAAGISAQSAFQFLHGFRHAPLMRDLELFASAIPTSSRRCSRPPAFRDGSCVVIHKDFEATCASLGRFSKRDAETFRDLHRSYGARCGRC